MEEWFDENECEDSDFDFENEEPELHCPVCGANWGIEEIDFQECDSCGYPENLDDLDGFFDEDYLDEEGFEIQAEEEFYFNEDDEWKPEDQVI